MPPKKKTASKSKTKSTGAGKTKPAAKKASGGKHPAVRVRMYRQGLGDCFLVTFNPGGAGERHMLIDCGTLGSKSKVKMEQVVENIRKTTNDHLHLLVATHEHKDHVSGFRDYKEEFEKIKVDNVWLAWTENANDELAKKLAKTHDDLAITAAAAFSRLKASGEDDEGLGDAIEDLLGFEIFGAAKFARTIDEAMDFVRKKVSEARYLKPDGKVLEENWLPGFRFYVLGPPYSEKKIRDLGDHGSTELYGIAAGLQKNLGAASTTGGLSTDPDFEGEMPFDPRFRLKESDPMLADFLNDYRSPENAWRKVGASWLSSAATLALQLDSLTNNTSLALAIERVSDGKVLIFPADAQQGNWLSWHDEAMKWKLDDSQEVTAADLLKRTVFYKVGHHGSHNATAKGKGLELMTSEKDLVAFIPVDREIALNKSPQGKWKMPARELYRTLLQKCQGRVVRADIGWACDAEEAEKPKIEAEFKKLAEKKSWTTWKEQQKAAEKDKTIEFNELYVDFLLK